MRVLTRTWQLLLKALDEISSAPNSMMAAEMAIIRITHVSDLPSPEELVKKLTNSHFNTTVVKKESSEGATINTTSSNYIQSHPKETNSISNDGNTALALDAETLILLLKVF